MDNSRDVLIVEDDDCTRALLAAVIEHYDFRPTLCSDGEAALHHLRTTGTGILLLDLLLPNRNGFEVLREIKCTQPDMLKRTIVLTAASDRTVADCSELVRVWKALRKPLDVAEFARELRACVAALAAQRIARVRQSTEKHRGPERSKNGKLAEFRPSKIRRRPSDGGPVKETSNSDPSTANRVRSRFPQTQGRPDIDRPL